MANGNQDTNVPQVPQTQPGPTSGRQAATTALMGLGGAIFAAGLYEQTGNEGIAEAGLAAVQASIGMVNNRFWKYEFENFQNSYGQQYQTQAKELWNAYEQADTEIDPSDMSDKAIAARRGLMQDLIKKTTDLDVNFMQNAAKFPGNPMIGNTANQLMESRNNTMKNLQGTYSQTINDATAQAQFQEARVMVEPGMLENKRGLAGARVDLTRAQAENQRAQARAAGKSKSAKDDTFAWPPKNVPMGQFPNWLKTKGAAILDQTLSDLEAQTKQQFIALDEKKFREGTPELDAAMAKARPQLIDKAIGKILIRDFDTQQIQDARTAGLGKYLDAAASTQVRPAIDGKLTPKEIEANAELAYPDYIGKLETLVRTKDYKSIEEALVDIQRVVKKDVARQTAAFSGSETTVNKIVTKIMKNIIETWDENVYLNDAFGKPPKGFLKRMEQVGKDFGGKPPKVGNIL